MAAPARLAGRPRSDVLPAEIAAVLTLLNLTATSLVSAILHPYFVLQPNILPRREGKLERQESVN